MDEASEARQTLTMLGSETVDTVGMDVVRRLGLVTARIYAAVDFAEMMQAVADGIVDGLGFGVAAVNHRQLDGDFLVVAASGNDDAADALMGRTVTAEEMTNILRHAERWGRLRFVPAIEQAKFSVASQWVPDIPLPDQPTKWHPYNMLAVPLGDDVDEPIAVVSVDLPPGGDIPSPRLQELLEIFTLQAGVVLTSAMTREEHTARLEHRAHHDVLTGLPNRRVLDERLDSLVAGVSGSHAAIYVVDLDDFKSLNDGHGHHVGDRALQACADAMHTVTRDGDLVARLGGDEFAVVASGIEPEAARQLRDRLDGLEVRVPGTSAHFTLSAGMAIVDGTSSPDEVVAVAGRRMYEAKARRRPAARP